MELCPCPSPPAACLAGSVHGLWGARLLPGAGSPVSTQHGPGVRLQHVVGPQEPRCSSARTKLRDLGAVPCAPAAPRSCCWLCRGRWRRWAGGWCCSGFPGGDKTRGRRARARSSQGHTEVVAASPPALRPRHCQPRGHEAAEASKPKAIGKAPGEEAGAGGGGKVKPQLCSPLHPELL